MFDAALLLAQRSPFRDMGAGFRDRREHFDPLDLLPWLLVLAGLIAGLALLSRYLNRQDKRRLYNSPRALLRALYRAHDLDRASRRLLGQLAKAHGISQPAQLFLDPDRFDTTLLGPELQRQGEAIEALRKKLFAHESPLIKAVNLRSDAIQSKPRAAVHDVASREKTTARAASATGTSALQAVMPASELESGEILSGEPEEGAPSLAERHAVHALEALMKQINASRTATPAPAAEASAPAGSSHASAAAPQQHQNAENLVAQ